MLTYRAPLIFRNRIHHARDVWATACPRELVLRYMLAYRIKSGGKCGEERCSDANESASMNRRSNKVTVATYCTQDMSSWSTWWVLIVGCGDGGVARLILEVSQSKWSKYALFVSTATWEIVDKVQCEKEVVVRDIYTCIVEVGGRRLWTWKSRSGAWHSGTCGERDWCFCRHYKLNEVVYCQWMNIAKE